MSDLGIPPTGTAIADDFVPLDDTLTTICVFGTYMDAKGDGPTGPEHYEQFECVFKRNDTGKSAELVKHDGEMVSGITHFVQEFGYPFSLRDKEGCGDEVLPPFVGTQTDQLSRVQHADQLVGFAVDDREAAVDRFGDECSHAFVGPRQIN